MGHRFLSGRERRRSGSAPFLTKETALRHRAGQMQDRRAAAWPMPRDFFRNAFSGGVVSQFSTGQVGPCFGEKSPGADGSSKLRVFSARVCGRRCRSVCFGEANRRFQEKMSGRYSTAACSPSGSGRTAVPASPAFSRAQLRAVSSASASSGSASFAGVPPLMRM